ncbi:hypothetical protein [Couchioplanes caeruleus]|uniref:Uncharacterized protein n=1 Tax=Couchioplanes caeruleus subsp. caeruleus TaxID=56427 RepID=A0A1K0FQV5_9ACTN|nr:hypothetical protein [Couchioplanes caeruleus]OJF15215.1 hypothetical protein BG844_05795 [Couchioplanes caeruleus subsp. caeruleus]
MQQGALYGLMGVIGIGMMAASVPLFFVDLMMPGANIFIGVFGLLVSLFFVLASGYKIIEAVRLGVVLDGTVLRVVRALNHRDWDLSSCEVRIDSVAAINRTHQSTPNGFAIAQSVVGQAPVLRYRGQGDDDWQVLGLHDPSGQMLPPRQLRALAAAVSARYTTGQHGDAAAALRHLAESEVLFGQLPAGWPQP